MGLVLLVPINLKGKFFLFFNSYFPPNSLKGSVILLKSLLDKLLSPINFIGQLASINMPSINLPKVPEFSAFITVFFYIYSQTIHFQ